MTKSVADSMLTIYCSVDDFLKTHPTLAQWRRSPYVQPPFSDAEVLTVALLQSVFEVAMLKQTYRLVARNWGRRFRTCPRTNNGWRGCTTCCPTWAACWLPPVATGPPRRACT